jgi:DNA repair protein RadC
MGFKDAGKPHYLGHRERLRRRFREAGADALPDYELLELILFRAAPRRDTKPLAKAILARFGSFAEALNAPEEPVSRGPRHRRGRHHRIQARARRFASADARRGARSPGADVLGPGARLLSCPMGFESKEQFRML